MATGEKAIDLMAALKESLAKTHTPGPWVAVEGAAHAKTTIKAGDIVVAECSGHGRYASESLADARLIAAAPEMLDVLEKCEAYLQDACDGGVLDRDPTYPLWMEVAAAIAKVRAGSEQ